MSEQSQSADAAGNLIGSFQWDQMEFKDVQDFAIELRKLQNLIGWKYMKGYFVTLASNLSFGVASQPCTGDAIYAQEFNKGQAKAYHDAANALDAILESVEEYISHERKVRGMDDDDDE